MVLLRRRNVLKCLKVLNKRAAIDGDVVNGAVQVGQGLNRLTAIEPAHTIVQSVMNEAIMSIRKAQRLIEIRLINIIGVTHMLPFHGKYPKLDPKSCVMPGAELAGDVELKEYASIWQNCALRGDVNKIVVGRYSNVQDNSVLHVDDDKGLCPR